MFQKLKSFDAYPKTVDDFRVKTYAGAIVSIVSSIFIIWLFLSQISIYMTTETHHELFVDTNRAEKLKINIDVVFHHLPCAYLSLDAMDVSGEHQFDVAHNIFKRRLSPTGEFIPDAPKREDNVNIKPKVNENDRPECGSCMGAENPSKGINCCNTCEEVRVAYQKMGWGFDPSDTPQCVREGFTKNVVEQNGEGCQVYGFLLVNKVAGNFHFAPGKSFQQHHMHVHDLQSFKGQFNLSHTISRLSFGNDFPGIKNPLDGVSKTEANQYQYHNLVVGSGMFQYYVKIVPTIYEGLNGNLINTNQYSVTEHYRLLAKKGEEMTGLPGLFFMYDLSPIMMKVVERSKSFASFITSVCAIVGGVFTVAGIFDSFIYQTTKSLKRKIDLGKAS
ncbi:endoplasmic reticulum-golgi intermediate compartment protein 3 [Heterostelium album PN500]|uniref:Endoplasmic reticulum-golgi intermediate compartment protein 3 n=1 Tax=Heterostelium pallidum (strain ATCC 26659 / Pp 5 / PN500) TaxID=670386 RepID=D3AXX6_HETP5|nr:endoplasmic reticulum-golgi intermediate compartment protein 3 [Heterostelium album PN500]EFA85803.1 endoplasmic reticulum-golgi intermediate compartment protein 3 [Heterostelium album PN500]|eukprot:XP_020437909.1 endoplasmic reticulum-golgi intermediate compartment protein 3 [Heterostelium album PN500]